MGNIGSPLPMVVVVGPYRSGTSLTVGILEALGGWFGENDVREGNYSNPMGFFEDKELDRICKSFVELPSHRVSDELAGLSSELVAWRREMESKVSEGNRFLVAKNPLFCLLGGTISRAWGENTKVIRVSREEGASALSIVKRKWKLGGNAPFGLDESTRLIKLMKEGSIVGFSVFEVLDVRFEDLIEIPERTVTEISEFLGFDYDEAMILAAKQLIRPELDRSEIGFVRNLLLRMKNAIGRLGRIG